MTKIEYFQKYQHLYVSGAAVIFFTINATLLATSVIMEASRDGQTPAFNLWEPFVWEYTSALSIMVLLPLVIRFANSMTFSDLHIGLFGLRFIAASLLFSVTHVVIMVAARKVIYWLVDGHYRFGSWGYEMIYEYRKDLWSFIFLLTIIKSYQFISSRLLGEANIIAEGEASTSNQQLDRLLVKKLGTEFIIRVEDIEWLEAAGNYVNLHVNNRVYPIRSTLSALVEKIAPKGFCRVHRSHAINLDYVESITPLSSGDSEIKLKNNKVLNLSRRYKEDLKAGLA